MTKILTIEILWLEVQVEKAPSQFVLFMVWYDNMRLGKVIEEREIGIWVEIDIVVKI